ncbi:MAG: hypothetical protein AAF670_08990 [Planctomycetota bacterium]
MSAPASEVHRRRRSHRPWLFRFLAILIGLAPVVALEAMLRWHDHPPMSPYSGAAPNLFIQDESGSMWTTDPQHSNHFYSVRFPVAKAEQTKRIFVLGGSTVAGRPFATETAFSTWLDVDLRHCESEFEFEVVNCGGVSYGIRRLRPILDEVLTLQPDAVVLYTGHNEFLEHHEVLAQPWWHPRLANWLSNLFGPHSAPDQQTRMNVHPDAPADDPFVIRTRLDQHGGLQQYRRGSLNRRDVEAIFEDSLIKMVRQCSAAGVPILFCVPVSDVIATPPFKIEPDPSLPTSDADAVRGLWDSIVDGTSPSNASAARAEQILELDPGHAGAHYFLGRKAIERPIRNDWLGVPDHAVEHLIQARDEDVCPLRASSRIEAIVREVAIREQVPLLETAGCLDSHRVANDHERLIAHPRWFADHVHPTIAGHQAIGVALARQFEKMGWVRHTGSSDIDRQNANRIHLQQLDETYFASGRQRLEGLKRWAAGRAGASPKTVVSDDHDRRDGSSRPSGMQTDVSP